MSWFTDLYRSAVGKKAVMAVTGLYKAPGETGEGVRYLNAYGTFLRHVGEPALPAEGALWIVRVVLLVAVVLHIWAAWQLARMSRAARPRDYAVRPKVHTPYASRTMRWGGVIILLFIVYHLLDFTFGATNPGFVQGDVYRNVVASFSRWYVSLFYILAQVALGFHLYHGLWSL